MTDKNDDSEDDEREVDQDTEMILDYLSHDLSADDSAALEARAKVDKDFRAKLSDIVLLKGLVMLALEKNPRATPPESSRECRKVRRLFDNYRRGDATTAETALLSRHLDECSDCDVAFSEWEQGLAETAAHENAEEIVPGGGWGGFVRRLARTGRRALIPGLVVAALSAGAFGIVGLLSSSAEPGSGARLDAPGGPARPMGALLDTAPITNEVDRLRARDPEISANPRFGAITTDIVEDGRTPEERALLYDELGKKFGQKVERILFACAANERGALAKAAAYNAIDLNGCDPAALLDATRREVAARSESTFLLLRAAIRNLNEDLRNELRKLFASDSGDPVWRARVLRSAYAAMKSESAVQSLMRDSLASNNELVRAHAVITAAAAGDDAVIQVAFELLTATQADARKIAAAVIIRHGSKSDFERLLTYDITKDPGLASAIIERARTEQISITFKP